MALKVGAADVQDVKLGATQVAKVMLGTEQVWPIQVPRSFYWNTRRPIKHNDRDEITAGKAASYDTTDQHFELNVTDANGNTFDPNQYVNVPLTVQVDQGAPFTMTYGQALDMSSIQPDLFALLEPTPEPVGHPTTDGGRLDIVTPF